MKGYYRVALGRGGLYAEKARLGGYICVGFLPKIDLAGKLPDSLREFNEKFIPIYLKERPDKTRIGAGLACGQLWTVAKGIKGGDIILSPTGRGEYLVGEVTGDYEYRPEDEMPHHRPVQWLKTIARDDMNQGLKNSSGSIATVANLSKYAVEIEALIGQNTNPTFIVRDETVEDPSEFALEKHLEDFLVKNWKSTELGKRFDIYEEEGEMVGQQYPSDTGPIDILAINKDKKEIAVIELKKGRASDVVVGQIQRYMGYVKEELAEDNQVVRGIIIAFEDDVKINRALSVAPNIEFYTYKINFKLEKK